MSDISTAEDKLTNRIERYRQMATTVRREIIEMCYASQSGHLGGSLSAVESLIWLYHEELDVCVSNPDAPDRDRFVYSKGHACPVLYSVLSQVGFINDDPTKEFRRFGGSLPGHSSPKITGVEFPSGSLGQGFSYANGLAMAADLDNIEYQVYSFAGDGEIQEGNVWEAAMTAADKNLDHVAIVDRNRKQNDLPVSETMKIEPLREKFNSFGWETFECNGHSFKDIADAFERIHADDTDNPSLLIANTIKGKGVHFMQNKPNGYHAGALTGDEFDEAMEDLGFDPKASEVTPR